VWWIGETVIVNSLLYLKQLLPYRRCCVGLDQQAVESRLLPHHRTNLRRKEDRYLPTNLLANTLDDFLGTSLMNRIQVGKQEADSHCVDACREQLTCRLLHFRFIKRNDLVTKHVNPLGNAMNPALRSERFRMYVSYCVQGICVSIASPTEAAIHQ